MKRVVFTLCLLLFPAVPALAQVSASQTYHLSVTIPASVTSNTTQNNVPTGLKNPAQLAQTQTVIRGHKTVVVTSIVVP